LYFKVHINILISSCFPWETNPWPWWCKRKHSTVWATGKPRWVRILGFRLPDMVQTMSACQSPGLVVITICCSAHMGNMSLNLTSNISES